MALRDVSDDDDYIRATHVVLIGYTIGVQTVFTNRHDLAILGRVESVSLEPP
jgi:hypothetical protein